MAVLEGSARVPACIVACARLSQQRLLEGGSFQRRCALLLCASLEQGRDLQVGSAPGRSSQWRPKPELVAAHSRSKDGGVCRFCRPQSRAQEYESLTSGIITGHTFSNSEDNTVIRAALTRCNLGACDVEQPSGVDDPHGKGRALER